MNRIKNTMFEIDRPINTMHIDFMAAKIPKISFPYNYCDILTLFLLFYDTFFAEL